MEHAYIVFLLTLAFCLIFSVYTGRNKSRVNDEVGDRKFEIIYHKNIDFTQPISTCILFSALFMTNAIQRSREVY